MCLYLARLMAYSALNIGATLKCELGVVQSHRKWCQSIDYIRLHGLPRQVWLYIVPFSSYLTLNNNYRDLEI